MRDLQDFLGIEVMAQRPAAARSLDDRPGVDEHAIQIKQESRTME
jgi:hypothetical protein